MIPAKFDYFAPTTVDEAISLLSRHDDAKILAGGQSLIPAMRYRLAVPATLVDINKIQGLSYIREENGYLALGAMTREVDLDDSEMIQKRYPLLADTVRVIADPLVRNLATVGGNIAHADPANDHPATMLAYNASVVAKGPGGERVIPIDEFFVDLFTSALEPNEILTEIRIPQPAAGDTGAYHKIERKVGDYAIGAVAVQLNIQEDTITRVRIGLTNVSPVPMRATGSEAALMGKAINDEAAFKAAGDAAASECEPAADLRGSEDYKRDVIRVLLMRTVKAAIARTTGG